MKTKMDKIIDCAYMAMLAYLKEKEIRQWLADMFVNYEVILDKARNLEYFIVIDRETRTNYISIRGTQTNSVVDTLKDIRDSIYIVPKKINGSYFHRGYALGGERLFKDIQDHLYNGNFNVLIGHSLGGALAEYIAYKLDVECSLYTYGAPRLTTRGFYEKNTKVSPNHVVDINDIVPLYLPIYDARPHGVLQIEAPLINKPPANKAAKFLYLFTKMGKNALMGTVLVGIKSHGIQSYIKELIRIKRRGN